MCSSDLVQHVNDWWREHLLTAFGLQSALELQYETHFTRFLMPTIRGAEEGSKKRYAGLVVRSDGSEEMVYKGLETVRSDWSPLARRFQQELYQRIFHRQPHQDYIRDYVRRTLSGEFDELLIYRKRLRRRLDDYERNVPPHVRAARLADEYNDRLNRPRQYQQCRAATQHSRQGGQGVERLPHPVQTSFAEQIGGPATQQQEPAKCHAVGADHPLQLLGGKIQVHADLRQGNKHDGGVQRDDQLRGGQQRQHPA